MAHQTVAGLLKFLWWVYFPEFLWVNYPAFIKNRTVTQLVREHVHSCCAMFLRHFGLITKLSWEHDQGYMCKSCGTLALTRNIKLQLTLTHIQLTCLRKSYGGRRGRRREEGEGKRGRRGEGGEEGRGKKGAGGATCSCLFALIKFRPTLYTWPMRLPKILPLLSNPGYSYMSNPFIADLAGLM